MIDVGWKLISNFTSEAGTLFGTLGPYVLNNIISVKAGVAVGAAVVVGAAPTSVIFNTSLLDSFVVPSPPICIVGVTPFGDKSFPFFKVTWKR